MFADSLAAAPAAPAAAASVPAAATTAAALPSSLLFDDAVIDLEPTKHLPLLSQFIMASVSTSCCSCCRCCCCCCSRFLHSCILQVADLFPPIAISASEQHRRLSCSYCWYTTGVDSAAATQLVKSGLQSVHSFSNSFVFAARGRPCWLKSIDSIDLRIQDRIFKRTIIHKQIDTGKTIQLYHVSYVVMGYAYTMKNYKIHNFQASYNK